jgi:hypothetical protein
MAFTRGIRVGVLVERRYRAQRQPMHLIDGLRSGVPVVNGRRAIGAVHNKVGDLADALQGLPTVEPRHRAHQTPISPPGTRGRKGADQFMSRSRP